ncbi:hypothetical protein SAMN05421741_12931 [Paenimyroides ummariense]|uniref:GLPGLI family protein n=1 Tax=Paenimyroides ummariense TaxID=913024 RepID=A0A1I5FLS1_9FLAO|nr:hypothetical protein [Paenimyroides ummariense]SFO24573.1 hypothetical protein SAMN05421741_12931 [Paenimyroides ummariense]
MYRFLITILFFVFSTFQVLATSQAPDKIIFNDKEYSLLTNPLEAYFKINPEKRPKNTLSISSLWRGYVATFEIKNNRLYVSKIEIVNFDKENDSMIASDIISDLFPSEADRYLDCYSGILTICYGEIVDYVHMGYESAYENYILIEITAGNFIKSKEMSLKELNSYKKAQFKIFKKTPKYLVEKEALSSYGFNRKHSDKILRDKILYINKHL